ncbi:MAG: polysaccharide deacetylase family protein [Synergistaceae bacterium]|jgi:peptidoglycan/xylan/chitin deacetylase (PgdA/CDA1 family)|nr:polysaccharide deacetylase family protein [Synergistaceae bacterium]
MKTTGKPGHLHGLERGMTVALLGLFLCVQWGPLSDERGKWGIAAGDPFVKEIVLTFDDGPRESGIYELISTLRRLDVRGTFFLVGKFAERYGFITRDIDEAGHEIENHSYTHPRLYTLWTEKVMREVERCNEVVDRLGIRVPRFMRPPGGGFNLVIFDAMRRMNMKLGLWSVNTADYTGRSAQAIASQVLGDARPGAIILMHSGVPATVEALPEIVTALRGRGYRFVTLQELWDGGSI